MNRGTVSKVFIFTVVLLIGLGIGIPRIHGAQGDVNNDGDITLADALVGLQVCSFREPAGINAAGDTDGDARIGLQEVLYVLQRVSEVQGGGEGTDASLSGLTLSYGTLGPAFDPDILSYYAMVENSISTITVTAAAADPNASLSVRGVAVLSGESSVPIQVNVGLNPIGIVVTAEDGTTTQTYTVNVYRQEVDESSNAYLADLVLSAGDLNPVFHPDTLQYTANVFSDTAQITVTATAQASGSLLMINSAIVTSGVPSAPIALVAGANDPIHIVVMSEDETETRNYTITITRGDTPELSADAFLDGLILSPRGLNEAFFAGRLNYTALYSYETLSATVIPTAADPAATIRINDTEVASGQPSHDIPLSVGENTITMAITAPDGIAARTYRIIITREAEGASANSLLHSLSVSPGALDRDFIPGILAYTAHVHYYVDQVIVTATAADPDASITIQGNPLLSGQTSSTVSLAPGENMIPVVVTAQDGITASTYLLSMFRHGATGDVAKTVFVVDAPAAASDEFETLTAAISYLSGSLTSDQLGEVRIRTTQPMLVESLEFACNIIITLEEGASNTIMGSGTAPLSITANGSLDLAGLNFVNSPGFVIHSGVGLAIVGSQFSGDTTVNVNSGFSPLSDRTVLSAKYLHGAVAKDLNFASNKIPAGLTINALAATQKDIAVTDTTALSMGVTGTFTGQSYLKLSGNPVEDLTLTLDLKDETTADVDGHLNLNLANADITMEGAANFNLKSSRAAQLDAQFNGLKGMVRLENTIIMKGSMNVGLKDGFFEGSSNSYTDLDVNVGYSSDLVRFGLTESGGYAYKTFRINAPNAPSNAEITVGFDNFKFNGDARYYLGGKATLQMSNNTTLGAEGYVQFNGSAADCTITDLTGQAKLFIEATDPAIQFNLSASRLRLADDFITETATANISGHFDEVEIMKGIVGLFVESDFTGGLQVPERTPLQTGDQTIFIRGLNVSAIDGRTPLMIKGFDVPVTIENCQINGQYWSMAILDVDGDVTIQNNTSLTGGILLDGDPGMAGAIISGAYTVNQNTISQSMQGGSCLFSHAIRNVTAQNNTMTALGFGTHGVHVSGGKVTVSGGSIITTGPDYSQAIGVGGSAGGHNGVVHADSVEIITGAVQTGPQGYVRLTNNTFSNAKIIDYKEGLTAYPRLLNDPVADNSGLNPDEDIIGSLIDWNNDEHHCPDYPTKCDQWDEDNKECGCGESDVSPPSEPGI